LAVAFLKPTDDDARRDQQAARRGGQEWDAEVELPIEPQGALIDRIHEAISWADGIPDQPRGLTHRARPLRDALSASALPVVEVHLPTFAREEFREHPACPNRGGGTRALAPWATAGLHALLDHVERAAH
jgi:3-dehydroquinate dehydratase-2